MIELTENAIFEKEKEVDIVHNVDMWALNDCIIDRYLERVRNNCTKISVETGQEELEYIKQKEEMKSILDSLEAKKQMCWVINM